MKSLPTQYVAAVTLVSLLVNGSIAANECPVMMTSDTKLSECHSSALEPKDDGECMTLQQELNLVSSASDPMNCVAVYVHTGDHYLTSPVNFSSANHVHIIGVGNNISIICNYSKVRESSGSEYMWLFESTTSVIMINLNFYECPYPFRILYAQDVYVADSSFRYFKEAVLDVFNCENVTLSGLRLEHNYGTGIVPLPYRGNTGGIAIGYNELFRNLHSEPHVQISNSILHNNSALATSRVISISATAFAQVFTGRGGALGIFVNESYHNVSIEIINCSIVGNYARSFGGGIYVIINGDSAQHLLLVNSTDISSNMAMLHGGGGMQFSFLSNGIPTAPHRVVWTDCLFNNNTAKAGGGMYIFTSFLGSDGNSAKLERCVFSNNHGLNTENDYGAAIVISLLTIFRQRITLPRHEIVDCTFITNRGLNGIVSIGYAPTSLKGNNRFVQNEGTSLRIVGAVVDVQGDLSFEGNIVQELGQLSILSFGQILLHSGVSITFIRNQGRFGAGIGVHSTRTLGTFTDLMFNPRCFILHHESSIPPSQWSNVSITFEGNTATLASSIYVSMLDRCSWYGTESILFNKTLFPDWPLWNFIDEVNTGFNESDDKSFSIGTAVDEIHTENAPTIVAWPGQRIRLNIRGIDEFGHLTTANIRFTFHPYSGILASFTPQIVVIAPDSVDGILRDQFTLTYSLTETVDCEGNTSLGEVSIQIPFATTTVASDRFVLQCTECPGGYILKQSRSSGLIRCECEDVEYVLHCEEDQDSILIKSGYWALKRSYSSSLKFLPCPPGYCGCSQNTSLGSTSCVNVYANSDPDMQCVCGRKGALCGGCRDGKGFSVLLNRCVTCTDVSGLLILLLIAADVSLFMGIILIDKPLASWIYPFLFYMQMVPHVSQYFPGNFETIGQYAYYFNSGLGFYFIYDFCLYENMNPLVSYFLRFIPLFILLSIRTALIIIRVLASKCGKHVKSLHNHGVLWIAVVIYSPTVHTAMSFLHCVQLSSTKESVWYVSGEIRCFTGGHIPLALLAILVLLFCALLIPLSWILATKEMSEKSLSKLNSALQINFKTKFKWWSSVELGRRFLFLLFFVPFPRSIVGPIVILVLSITVYGFAKPYKERLANILELLVQSSFLFLLLLMSVASTNDTLLTFSGDGTTDRQCNNQPSDVAGVAWLLFPVLYFPHVLFLVISGGILSHLAWVRYRVHRDSNDSSPEPPTTERSHTVSALTRTEVIILSGHEIEGTATMSRIKEVNVLSDTDA